MAHDVVLIPGDGIGPEITSAMRRVVDASGVDIAWNVVDAGAGVMDEFGTPPVSYTHLTLPTTERV